MAGPLFLDRVLETSTTTGTGTLTLAGAVTGYQTFGAVGDANITDAAVWGVDANGTPTGQWEVFKDATYTASGTTLTRGTFLASSTGSAVSFSAGTKYVALTLPAELMSQATWKYVSYSSDADLAAVVNTFYVASIAAWASDNTLTLPATAAVGDRVGLYILDGDDAFEFLITATAGDTLNGVAGGTEWSRLFIANECVIMRCVVANTTWIVEYDGRIPIQVLMRLSTDATGESAGTFTIPTAASGVWTADTNVGGCASTSDGRAYARRAGNFIITACALPITAPGVDKYFSCRLWKTGTTSIITTTTTYTPTSVASISARPIADCVPLVVDDYVNYAYASQDGTRGLDAQAAPWQASYLSMKEVI